MKIKTFDMETTGFYDMETEFDSWCYLLQLNQEKINRNKNILSSDDCSDYQKAMAEKGMYDLLKDESYYKNRLIGIGAEF